MVLRLIERDSWTLLLPQITEYWTVRGICGKQPLITPTRSHPGGPGGGGTPRASGTRPGAGALSNCTVTGIWTMLWAGMIPTLVTKGVTRYVWSTGTLIVTFSASINPSLLSVIPN